MQNSLSLIRQIDKERLMSLELLPIEYLLDKIIFNRAHEGILKGGSFKWNFQKGSYCTAHFIHV